MSVGIYIIRNTVNGKCYVGQSTFIPKRVSSHKQSLIRSRHYNNKLQRAWDKYGADAFSFETLIECLPEELDDLEKEYIEKLSAFTNGYNQCEAAPGRGAVSDETKAKQRTAKLGRTLPVEQRKNMSVAQLEWRAALTPERKAEISKSLSDGQKGKTFSELTRSRIRATLTGFKHSAEARANMGATHVGKPRPPTSDETRAKIAATLTGRKQSTETIEKRAAKHRGQKRSPEVLASMRAKLDIVLTARHAARQAKLLLEPPIPKPARTRLTKEETLRRPRDKRRVLAAARERKPRAPATAESRARRLAIYAAKPPVSAETRAKLSAASLGRKYNEEFGAAVSAAKLAAKHKHTPESLLKMSEAKKAGYAKRKQEKEALLTSHPG